MHSTSTHDGLPLPQRYAAILAIALGITVAVVEGAIASVALPTIARELNARPAESIWIVNAYQLAIIISLLTLSFLGDMLGYRRIYQWVWSCSAVRLCSVHCRTRSAF